MKRPGPPPPRKHPLARSPLRPSVAAWARVRIKRVNAKRKARLFAEQFESEAFVRFVQQLPCGVCGDETERGALIAACHVKTRGAGGKAANNIYPGCSDCHDIQHHVGIRIFERIYGVSLRDVAAKTWAAWLSLNEQAA